MGSMTDIKAALQHAATREEYVSFIEEYSSDERAGVKKLVESAEKKLKALEKEMARIEEMKKYEKEYAHLGPICGIDEVGRFLQRGQGRQQGDDRLRGDPGQLREQRINE